MLHDPKHPLWATIRFVVIAIILGVMICMNSKEIDAGEIMTFIGTLTASGGAELLTRKIGG